MEAPLKKYGAFLFGLSHSEFFRFSFHLGIFCFIAFFCHDFFIVFVVAIGRTILITTSDGASSKEYQK
jgi:hypothetical protein